MTDSRPRLVLTVGATPPPYFGMSVATECLLEALDQAGLPHVHVDIADRRGLANMGALEVGNIALALRHGAQFTWALVRRRPDVVYLPISQSTLGFLRDALFLIPARLARRRVIVHLHGSQLRDYRSRAPFGVRALMRWCLRDVSRAIVLGDGGEREFEGLLAADRVRVIPNGLPDSRRRREGDARHDGIRVLYLSTLMREKGIIDAVAAIAQAARVVAGLQLVFAGDWYSEQDRLELESSIARHRAESLVQFLGPVEGKLKDDALADADIFLLPPRHAEGMPFAILEAMRAGLPIVTTRSGYIPQVVVDGECGLVLPSGDVDAIARGLVELAESTERRTSMGSQARERFLAKYTLDRWACEIIATLSEAASSAAPLWLRRGRKKAPAARS